MWEKLLKENINCWFRKTTHEINKSCLSVSVTLLHWMASSFSPSSKVPK